MNSILGMPTSSVKKMIDESNKNTVKNGENIILPIGLAIEIGIPHAINIGNDTNVTYS
jgi:hypothetical protein